MRENYSVLLVDDEPPLRHVLHKALTTRGFSVEETGSAERAIHILAQSSFDAVMLDINLPGMNGVEACQRIRAQKHAVAILMVTVRDKETDVIHALEAGADDYITKPFRLGELVARLRAVIRRSAAESPVASVIRIDDLEIDLDRRLLHKSGGVIHLTPTEFDFLALLMKSPGVLHTHNKLLRTIWGPEHADQLEYLRTYVRTLRKKIEDDPTQPKYIITEPWVGYRFQSAEDTATNSSEDRGE